MHWNAANLLTMARIAVIPPIILFLAMGGEVWLWTAFALYALACVTDYFDGYLARAMNQVSALGRFLDPITVSGLREFLAEIRVGVPVSQLAKWKTTIQMLCLGFLIVGDAGPAFLPTAQIGTVLLWAAAGLTVITGFDYLRAGLKHLVDRG